MSSKSELRQIVLDIIFGKENVFLDPWQFGHLTAGVAEVLYRRAGFADSAMASLSQPERKLEEDDWLLVQEIFWDLIFKRVITIGSDKANPEFPHFRLHSSSVNR
jgi:hypothetical protein